MSPVRWPGRWLLRLVLAALVGGCSAGPSSSVGPSSSAGSSILPGPSILPGTTLTTGELALLLIDRLGPRWFCDPDFYPLARPSFEEGKAANERFAEIQDDSVLFAAVVRELGYGVGSTYSDAQKLEIYRLWKAIVSVSLEAVDASHYRFDYLAQPVGDAQYGTETKGTVDTSGTIVVDATSSAEAPNCPICLARGTAIDTPAGEVAVERLRPGDPVWTLDEAGRRVAGLVIAIGSTRAPANHRVIRLVLADGRTVTASPGHPLADGRLLGTLQPGDLVDGSRVATTTKLAYRGGETFDLVVSGPTGIYLSDGIPLGSTLR
ncbi:MAG TPA: Hint domain-containing protein [Candidatus Limnocylindrales bacterium]